MTDRAEVAPVWGTHWKKAGHPRNEVLKLTAAAVPVGRGLTLNRAAAAA